MFRHTFASLKCVFCVFFLPQKHFQFSTNKNLVEGCNAHRMWLHNHWALSVYTLLYTKIRYDKANSPKKDIEHSSIPPGILYCVVIYSDALTTHGITYNISDWPNSKVPLNIHAPTMSKARCLLQCLRIERREYDALHSTTTKHLTFKSRTHQIFETRSLSHRIMILDLFYVGK